VAYILGITGGMSAGKSTAAACLKREGVYIIDVDELSRPMIMPGSECYSAVVSTFGKQICNLDGSVNRTRLARAAFATPRKTKMLNDIFREPLAHAIKLEIMQGRAQRAKLILVVAAILFEQGWSRFCHGIVNISAPDSVRLQRAIRRGMSERDVTRRMASQLSERERMNLSDWTVYTQPTKQLLCESLTRLAKENKWI